MTCAPFSAASRVITRAFSVFSSGSSEQRICTSPRVTRRASSFAMPSLRPRGAARIVIRALAEDARVLVQDLHAALRPHDARLDLLLDDRLHAAAQVVREILHLRQDLLHFDPGNHLLDPEVPFFLAVGV